MNILLIQSLFYESTNSQNSVYAFLVNLRMFEFNNVSYEKAYRNTNDIK